MFYLKVKDLEDRTKLLDYLKKNGILAVFHYVPLHSAPAGFKFGRFDGDYIYTTKNYRIYLLVNYYLIFILNFYMILVGIAINLYYQAW